MSDWCREPPPPALLEGIAQLNRGEFFAQHETLEDLWRQEPRAVRSLYQGILQVGLALYHVQRGNHHGAVAMLTRGSAHLRRFAPSCQTVDVDDLLDQADRILSAVESLSRNGLSAFDWSLTPRVRLVAP